MERHSGTPNHENCARQDIIVCILVRLDNRIKDIALTHYVPAWNITCTNHFQNNLTVWAYALSNSDRTKILKQQDLSSLSRTKSLKHSLRSSDVDCITSGGDFNNYPIINFVAHNYQRSQGMPIRCLRRSIRYLLYQKWNTKNLELWIFFVEK